MAERGSELPVGSASARTVARNTAYQLGARLWSTAVSLVSISIATRYLGTLGFGILSTAMAYFYFFGTFADWGTYTYAVREIANKPESTRKVVTSVLYVRLILSFAVAVLA